MKVIFDESFLTKLQKPDNTLIITNYIIGSFYKNISSVHELFQNTYLSRDIRRTNKYIINAIWEEKDKILKINLEIDDSIQENLSENEYNFIYCYYRELGDGEESEKIAFILSGDLTKTETEYNIDPIDFSINKNLISVIFPSNTLSNIRTNQEEDTNFLEGYGIQLGTNIFTIDGNGLNDELVSKDSYYRYVRNTKTSGNSNILPYLSIDGETINNYYTYTIYNNLTIYTSNTNYSENPPIDSTLYKSGGSLKILGEYNYTKYTVRNNTVINIETGTDDIIGLIDNKLTCVENNGMKFEYDNINNILTYSKVDNTSNIVSGIFTLSIYCYDPLTNTTYTINSNQLKLSQEETTYWEVSTNDEYFMEDGKKLYLFSHKQGDTKTFTIKINGQLTSGVSVMNTITNNGNDTLVTNNYFDVSSNSKYDETNNRTIVTITLSTKQENTSDKNWNPLNSSSESQLILTTVTIGDNFESFYMVQCPNIGGIDAYIKTDDSYEKVTELILPNTDNKSMTLYPSRDNDTVDPKYWIVLDRGNKVTVSPTNGELNSNTPSNWDNPIGISIVANNVDNNSVFKTDLGSILLGRFSSPSDNTININNWRDVVTLGRIRIPVMLDSAEANIETVDELTISELGIYEFKVKSNCSLRLTIYGDGVYNKNNSIVFYDTNTTTLDLEQYDDVNGISIYIKHQESYFAGAIGNLLDYGNIIITPLPSSIEDDQELLTKQIDLKLLTYKATINYLEENNNIIFIDANLDARKLTGTLRYFCNKTSSLSISSSRSLEILKNELNFSKSTELPNRGYNWTEIEWGYSNVNNSWPSKYSGSLYIRPYNETESISYYFYQFGPAPTLSLIDANNFIYIGPNAGDYVDVKFRSKLTTLNVVHNDEPGYSGTMNRVLSRTSTPEVYNLRIQRTEANLTNKTILLGTVTISSYVDIDNFTDGGGIIQGMTQEELNKLLKPASVTLTIYQNSLISGNVEITGSIENVAPEGERREYGIAAPIGYKCEVYSDNSYATVQLGTQNNIIFNVNDIIDDNSKSFILSNTTSDSYINLSKSRAVGFTAVVSINSVVTNRKISMLQSGYQSGVIYRSDTVNNTLYVGNTNSINPLVIKEYVPNGSSSFSFFLGKFNINEEIVDGTSGDTVTFEEIGSDSNVLTFTNDKPIFYSDNNSNKSYNVTVNFPENTNTEEVTRSFLARSIDSNTGTESIIRFDIVQSSKTYTIISSDTSDYLYFHSTGHCIQNGYSNLDIIDSGIETDIPADKNIEITIANTITGEEHAFGEEQLLGFEYTTEYISIGSELPSSRVIRIRGKINPNNNNTELPKEYQLRLRAEGDNRVLWSKLIRQGFSNVYLELPDGEELSNGQEAGKNNPYTVSGDNSETNRLIFPVRYTQQEYTKTGGTLNSITNEIDLSLISMDSSSDYMQKWTDINNPSLVLGGNVFYVDNDHQFGTYYIKTDASLQDKVPFIENRYTTKEDYYSTEIPLKIEFNLLCPFESISSDSILRYNYTLYLLKEVYTPPYITIVDNNIPKVSSSKTTMYIRFKTNASSNVIIYNSDKNNSESWLHIGEYNLTSNEDNTYSVKIDLDENKNSDDRIGEITFSIGSGEVRRVVTITQSGSTPYITCEDPIKEVNAIPEGDFIEFTINHNIDYSVGITYENTDQGGWIRQIESSPASTEYVDIIRFAIDENTSTNNRTCKIKLMGGSKYPNVTQELTVVQRGGEEYITLNPNRSDYSIFDTGGSIEFTITTNSSEKCTVNIEYLSGGENWITLNAKYSEIDKDHYYYDISSNGTELDRSANIIITSKSKKKIISVTQSGKNKPELIINKGTYFNIPFNDSKNAVENLTFETNMSTDNINISVNEEDSSWLKAKITNGNTIIIEVTSNTSTEKRSGIITLSVGYSDAPDLTESKEITIEQDGRPYINADSVVNLEDDKPTEKIITISSNVKFSYSIEDSWITFNRSNLVTAESYEYSFYIRGNESTETRTGRIIFRNESYDLLTTVEIVQPGMITPIITISNDNLTKESDKLYKIDIPGSGGSIIFDASSTYNNLEAVSDSWITKSDSSEDNHFEFLVDSYSSGREGTITVSSKNINGSTTLSDEITIRVNQSSLPTELSVDPKETSTPLSAYKSESNNTTEFTITCNYDDFTLVPPDWINCEKVSNEGNKYKYQAVINEDNPTTSERTGDITIIRTPDQVKFTVRQEGKDPEPNFSIDQDTFSDIPYTESNITITISDLSDKTEINYDITEGDTWIVENTIDSNSYSYTIKKNSNEEVRTGKIIFTATNREGSVSKEVSITQLGSPTPTITIDPDPGSEGYSIDSNGGEIKFSVTTNIEEDTITVENGEEYDWLTIRKDDSSENSYIVEVSENSEVESRSGIIRISTESTSKDILITQTGVTE